MQLPQDISPVDFDEHYRLDPGAWKSAIEEVGHAHGIPFEDFSPFSDGSNLIAAVADEFVIKIFPPFHRHQWESEWRVLRRLWEHGLSIPIPKLIAQGERNDHWSYVILSKLPGVTLESVWPGLSIGEKTSLMAEIGTMMAQVHSVPIAELHDLEPEWGSFLRGQVEKCHARHRRLGMPDWFLEGVDAFLHEKMHLIPDEPPVILTGEYTPFNLLVNPIGDQWRITGMIDFGDAMIGLREYDFLGPCLFLGEGRFELLDSLFNAYGYANPRKDEALRERLTVLAILHRYSNLTFQIRIENWESRVKSLEELVNLVFAARSE
jgi:hygromycin-B 7''-O-kinase